MMQRQAQSRWPWPLSPDVNSNKKTSPAGVESEYFDLALIVLSLIELKQGTFILGQF